MANQIYDNARYRFAIGSIDWRAASIILIGWSGTPDFLKIDANVAAMKARGKTELARSIAITAKSVPVTGELQTNNVIIPALPAGQTLSWMTMALSGATDSLTIPLLFTDDAENLPFLGNGLDVIVQPDWSGLRGWGRL